MACIQGVTMLIGIIILAILCVVSLIFEISTIFTLKKERESNFKKYIDQEYSKVADEIKEIQKTKDYEEERLQKALERNEQILNAQKEVQKQSLQAQAERDKAYIAREVENWSKSAQEAANEYSNKIIKERKEEINCLLEDLDCVKDELEKFHSQRAALNEVVRKERELREAETAHRIQLTDFDKEDIHFLNSISDKVHNKEVLNKLIWTTYLQKPLNEMINRICGSNIPKNVIYCIENIETHEKYIGKTAASIKDRWINHVKASLGISTISGQRIHAALRGNWDKFAFSIIEEVPLTENLLDREKFYIEMFESNIYGYNMKV